MGTGASAETGTRPKVIITPDSGVWLSAIRFGGVPGKALYYAVTIHQIAISDLIEEEILRNMSKNFASPRNKHNA